MKKRNKSLNFFKGLGCLGVVLIHVKFPNIFGEIVSLLSQFAVPIFIMTSGYFIYNSDLKTIKRRLLKMINIFLISFIIYTAFYIIVHFKTGDLSYWLISILSLKSLIKLIFFCTIDYAIHLWYLIAMIETSPLFA